jgi:UDP-N-acetylglucosamine:LPS N-acetylglucosamine transferase
VKICLTCSPGGHLSQLERLRPWWENHDRFWVVLDRDDIRSVLPAEQIISPYHPTTRSARNAVRNFFLAFRILRRERPDVIVTTGAGVAVPFFLAARMLGIATVYIEVFGRINLPTLSGRLCHPMADLFLLQWPEQQRFYPKGQLVGTLFPMIAEAKQTGIDT